MLATLYKFTKELHDEHLQSLEDFIKNRKGDEAEYLQFGYRLPSSLMFKIGLRSFILYTSINPTRNNESIDFRTFEIITNPENYKTEKLVEISSMYIQCSEGATHMMDKTKTVLAMEDIADFGGRYINALDKIIYTI